MKSRLRRIYINNI